MVLFVIVAFYCACVACYKNNKEPVLPTLKVKEGFVSQRQYEVACDDVCQDLPKDDVQPVCMMLSRYKKGYQFFANECHARRTICMENTILHMVHPSRCMKTYQFFMSVK